MMKRREEETKRKKRKAVTVVEIGEEENEVLRTSVLLPLLRILTIVIIRPTIISYTDYYRDNVRTHHPTRSHKDDAVCCV